MRRRSCQISPLMPARYRRRRCLLRIDNFFEWRAYAIVMKSGNPFALASIWENWRAPG